MKIKKGFTSWRTFVCTYSIQICFVWPSIFKDYFQDIIYDSIRYLYHSVTVIPDYQVFLPADNFLLVFTMFLLMFLERNDKQNDNIIFHIRLLKDPVCIQFRKSVLNSVLIHSSEACSRIIYTVIFRTWTALYLSPEYHKFAE